MRSLFDKIKEKIKPRDYKDLESLLAELKQMQELGFSDFQHIEQLIKSWGIGEVKNLDGNKCVLKSKSEVIEVETWIPPNGGFSKHWHDNVETCEVLDGVLQDKIVTPNVQYTKGQVLQYKPRERHMPYNPSSEMTTHLLVKFYR